MNVQLEKLTCPHRTAASAEMRSFRDGRVHNGPVVLQGAGVGGAASEAVVLSSESDVGATSWNGGKVK